MTDHQDMPPRIQSLKSRVVAAGLVGVVVSALMVAVVLGEAFERALLDGFDRRLETDLLTVAGQVTADGDQRVRMRAEPLDSRYARVFSGHYWVVSQSDRSFRSRSIWDGTLTVPQPDAGSGVQFRNIEGPLNQQLRSASQALLINGVTEPVVVSVASNVAATLDDIRGFRLMAGLAGAGVAVALLLMILLQARYALGPLRRITDKLELLRQGEQSQMDTTTLPSEIRPLAEELNALVDHQTRMLARARTSAGDLSHALKTPLAVLLAGAERQDPSLPVLVSEQVERMRASIERHLGTAALGSNRGRTAVRPVADSLLNLLERVYADRSLSIATHVDPALTFHGDQPDLEDMLGNLLENACKWSETRVVVGATAQSGRLIITVEDDGPGIPDNQLEAVLDRGTRLDRRKPGSGLGLPIVDELARSYGGALELRRLDPSGFCASLNLPGSAA